ncbi:MAG: hypothetical protein EON58_23150 [Alphaproteobacteria bacterium]|nr:MAG: hypothetical protein EON58_23150 [Alphaproteobacteria bacterium]
MPFGARSKIILEIGDHVDLREHRLRPAIRLDEWRGSRQHERLISKKRAIVVERLVRVHLGTRSLSAGAQGLVTRLGPRSLGRSVQIGARQSGSIEGKQHHSKSGACLAHLGGGEITT